MRLHEVRPPRGARHRKRRLGRGIAAGQGKTAGRGTKGQKSRAGAPLPAWFEGGQTPIHMRVPKLRGFKNRFRRSYTAVNVGRLAGYAEEGKVTPDALVRKGFAREGALVKILAGGEPGGAFEVHAHAFSAEARKKIEAAGGRVIVIDGKQEGATEQE